MPKYPYDDGNLLALGAVGALALAGGLRGRGSRAAETDATIFVDSHPDRGVWNISSLDPHGYSPFDSEEVGTRQEAVEIATELAQGDLSRVLVDGTSLDLLE